LFAANVLSNAGIECEIFERLGEDAVRARARAGVIEDRTTRLLAAHGLADGMLERGTTSGSCEFRRDGRSYAFDYASLCGSRHRVYPQQLLVGDLIDSLRSLGGQVRFDSPVDSIDLRRSRPAVRLADGTSVDCELVVGCDGFHGVSRAAVPGAVCSEVDFAAEWLTLLAEAAPWSEHQIYGLHSDGFAGHMPRTSTMTRYYLQVEPGTAIDDWDNEAIWSTLETRLTTPGRPAGRGRIVERSIMELRSAVTQPMQGGPIYLAGDAAHIVTPAGGKGMNLALQDADELVQGVIAFYHSGKRERLDGYSRVRLPRIWRAVEFSHWMLQMLLARRSGSSVDQFHEGLRAARLARLMEGGPFAEDFAIAYVGLDR
jgi:p-hydroxybenzoate 3-monooxygenase